MKVLFPGNVTLRYLQKFARRSYFSCDEGNLVVDPRRTSEGQREAFTHTVLKSLLKYFRNVIDILQRFEMELVWHRTRGEMELVRNLMDLTDEQINGWIIPENGEVEISDDANISNRPQALRNFVTVLVSLRIGLKKFSRNDVVGRCLGRMLRIRR